MIINVLLFFFRSGDTEKSSSYKFRIFGDILPDGDIPTSIEAAVDLMKMIPRMISGSSDGKGKPISYTLLPISTLTKYLQLDIAGANLVRQISSSTLVRVVQFFEAVEAAEQLLFDLHADVRSYRYCLQPEEIAAVLTFKGDVDVYTAALKADLAVIMKSVRSGERPSENVTDFLIMHRNQEFSPANITSKVNGWYDIKSKTQFARRVKTKGAKYLGSLGSLHEVIQGGHSKST